MALLDKLQDGKLFTSAELDIVKYIIENPKKVTESSVDELAETTFSSSSSVVRVCKKLGMKGFADFKIRLATELNSFLLEQKRIALDIPISKDCQNDEIPKIFLNLHYQALTDLYNSLDMEALKKAAEMIKKAQLVSIYGRGESLIIGEDFHYKLMRIGVCSQMEPLFGFQQGRVKTKINSEVALVISHYGQSRTIRSIISDLRHYKTPFIFICANKNSILCKLADVTIHIDNNETHGKMGSFASRVAMNFVLDCIYGILFNLDYSRNLELLNEHHERVNERNKIDNM